VPLKIAGVEELRQYPLGRDFRDPYGFARKEGIEMVVEGAVDLQERVEIFETPFAIIVGHFGGDHEEDIEWEDQGRHSRG
jgi:hypothetical protein